MSLEVFKDEKNPRRKSINTQGTNTTFKPDEYKKELSIPTMVDDYNYYKVGVDTHDRYQPITISN
jgi:hypothetical protein